jgi:hypothetical protein
VTGWEARLHAELAAVPDTSSWNRGQVAATGVQDAIQLVTDVRDVDPRAVWGRLTRWARVNPARLVMVTVALAALVDPEVEPRVALAWTDGLEREAA